MAMPGSAPAAFEPDDSGCIGRLTLEDARRGTCTAIPIEAGREVVIGRDSRVCDVTVDDRHISNKHLRIYSVVFDTAETSEVGGECIEPLVYAEDISSNGTLWNGHRMGYRRGSVLLTSGDVLTLAEGVTAVYQSSGDDGGVELGALVRREASVGPTSVLASTDALADAGLQAFQSEFSISNKCIGIGGYGSVHVAFDKKQRLQVACKIVSLKALRERILALRVRGAAAAGQPRPEDVQSQARVRAAAREESAYLKSKMKIYDREAWILQSLDHPNIISVERVYRTPDTIYIFEELVTAGDLFSFLEFKNGRLEDVETAVIVYQVLKGLEVVLTDFGCAKRVLPAQRLVSVMGTAEYIAPEIQRQKLALAQGYTATVDIWSLGCLTTVLLTGGSPFLDPSTQQYSPELAAAGNLVALEGDPDWHATGRRAKDFVRRCLVPDEQRRMNASEALRHPWFSNKTHRRMFERVYQHAIAGWRPRLRSGRSIMYAIDEAGRVAPVRPWGEEGEQSRVGVPCCSSSEQQGGVEQPDDAGNIKTVHFDAAAPDADAGNHPSHVRPAAAEPAPETVRQIAACQSSMPSTKGRPRHDVAAPGIVPTPPITPSAKSGKDVDRCAHAHPTFGYDASAWH
ncbi:hypothetical protein KEM52_006529 [Ascosphaera acerosa]|nr:hypothetical protein KEM52_006529 [Ascosphaera acerosa]